MDVKTAFLNVVIEEEVFLDQPRGFAIHGRDTHVCRLKKAFYGLNQAPRACYAKVDECLQNLGFSKTSVDSNLYFIFDQSDLLSFVLYVDDFIIIGNCSQLTPWSTKELNYEFDMKEIGLLHYLL